MKRAAFSLVELSIVLVILGLLTGGILSGQSLIRAAELRSASTEFSRYYSAAQAFRDKYFQLPGDFNNAQAFWGVANATPATCVTTASTDSKTCNGDSDGQLIPSAGSNDSYRFWQHLANAGLIEGSYTGVQDGTTNYSSTINNSPRSKVNGGLWFVWNWGTVSGNPNHFDGVYNNFFELGAATANADPNTALFKPEELWNIDTKLDDGRPATGKVVARGQTADGFTKCTDATVGSTLTANYLLSNSSLACIAIFRNLF